MMAQSQSQEKKPGKNMLWGGRFTGSFISYIFYLFGVL